MKTKLKRFQNSLLGNIVLCLNLVGTFVALATDSTFTDANWSSMGGLPGANGEVRAVAVDGAGNLYIGGDFSIVGDVFANRIAKWDGSKWTPLSSGMNGPVYALAVSGSAVYAGGNFTTAGGDPANYIAKWDGNKWTPLGSGFGDFHIPTVFALAVSGNDLYAGGLFTTAGGIAANAIAKWNGTSWSALDSGTDGYVFALAVSGSDLYAGGTFTMAGGSSANQIAKWNGSSWAALGSGIVSGSVYVLAVSGSDVYAGGNFLEAGDGEILKIAKWNGSNWSALGSGLECCHADPAAYALAVLGSEVYVGGKFDTAGDGEANHIAKWNGSIWTALGSGITGRVNALVLSGDYLYAGGNFTTAGGKVSANIARAYLLDLPALSVFRSGPEVKVSWPSLNTSDFTLEQTAVLTAPSSWVANTARITDDGTNKSVTLPATDRAQFFRLRRP